MGLFSRKKTASASKEKQTEKSDQLKIQPIKKPSSQSVSPQSQARLAHRILVHPLITEKTTLQNSLNQYTFMVSRSANKSEIKKAIRQLYGVTPLKVRIINNLGKLVRTGRGTYSQRKNWRKAIVSLPAGKKIDVYEGT